MEEKEKKEENFKANIVCSSKKRAEIDETAHLKKYVMWENKSNSCWVDASMALIAHNKVMKRASTVSPNSRMSNIISTYAEILSIINDENSLNNWLDTMKSAKERLTCIQDSTLQFLKPILKYKPGNPDSAFCSLYNILKEDSIIKGMFEVTWISIKTCINCDKTAKSTKTKTIITLSKVDSFDPESPTAIYCCNCKSEQEIKLEFVRLPPCLIFHFENGAGREKPPLSFFTHGRYYYLTGIMTHEKGQESNLNHFITWVRDLFVDKWLDCNDLNPDITYFTSNFPDIRFEDVFFYVYESFDELGKIIDYKRTNIESSEEEEFVLIDISEETDKCNSTSDTHEAVLNAKKCEVSSVEPQVYTETDSSKSLNKTLAGDEEHISDKKVTKTDSAHSSETPLNEIKHSENDKHAVESINKIPTDQGTGHYFQDEEHGTDGLFQDLRLSKDKSAKDVSNKVIQPDFNDKSKFDACKLNNQINSCFDQKQNDGIVLPYEEKRFENTPSTEKLLGIEVKEDERNKSLLPGNEIHKSELKIGKPEDLTKADIAESGTSYVKLSFRRKKNPDLTSFKQDFMKKNNKLASDETITHSARKSPRCVKETKNLKRSGDEGNYMPAKRPRRNQKDVKTLKDLQPNVNEKDKSHLMLNKDCRLSLQDKSKINSVKKNTKQKNKISHVISRDSKIPKDFNQVCTNQETPTFSATSNSHESDNDVGRVMKGFKNVLSTHAPGCSCESNSLEETINAVVDYTFAYLYELSQELKKAKSFKKHDAH